MSNVRPVKFKRDRGFFTFAQNSKDTDYVRLAYGLALSIKATQREHGFLSIAVTPGTIVPEEYRWAFDEIIEIPWTDNAVNSSWKLENEWKAYHITPYRETIKLDTDMLFLADYTDWWDSLARNDISPTLDVVDYRGNTIRSDYYRKVFTENSLPNVYSGFFYFKQNERVQEFFQMVELLTFNWEMFTYEFLDSNRPKYFSTDVAFALALKILDLDGDFSTHIKECPTFVHMKSHIQGWAVDVTTEDWTQYIGSYFTPDLKLKIGLQNQYYPFHYHLKNFLTDEMIEFLEESVNAK